MKKFLVVSAALALLVSVTGCAKKEAAAGSNKLVVWSFTDELQSMIEKYYKPSHPGVAVEYSLTPTEQFPSKLDPVLSSGQGAPDVFALESDFVRKYIESGLLLDITDIYESNKDKLLAYPAEVGSYNGKVYGMSWQAAPGALFYRRSLAKKYLGTDDPAEVQTYFTDFDKFLETAELLKTTSGGKCVVVSTTGDLLRPFLSGRANGWIVDGKLVVDPVMLEYMDFVKILRDKDYSGQVAQWSEGWFAAMQGTLTNETGDLVEAFSFFLPTWGLHYVLKQNAPDTAGDWAMVPGPVGWRWGGTWIGAWKNTKNPEGAKDLIRYLTTDDAFLEAYAKDSGDLVDNLKVVDKIKDSYSEPFLGGQNHYAAFAEMAKNVDGKLTQGTDQAVEALFQEAATAYMLGEKTKEQAAADFKAQVSAQLGF
ncbi:MAG: ABC transporter substrate-binding protein [Treponema sp.]|jgi:ABC-type glycerol-3-phosphate transport system substrate-binding protein|nr:ABC transporter substrate-binding protein [Treponema sp.]